MSAVVFPAEWEPHRAMLMEFPVFWKSGDIAAARRSYAEVARTIACFEPVTMIATPENADLARELCGETVEVLPLPHDDAWARDNCPTFVKTSGGALAAINWHFNAWGGKYPTWELDNAVPQRLCDLWGIPRTDAPIVLEGGSIHTNGAGTLLTTSECLLNPNRNPAHTPSEIERVLREHLGLERVIWLPFGVDGDETDGHVDNICCFIGENTALIQWTDDTRDPNHARCRADAAVLASHGVAIEKITAPPAIYSGDERLTASYVNFVFTNGGLVIPAFGGIAAEADAAALAKMRALFPNREVVAVNTLEILKGGGNIHCVTQQIPA
ncbi:MAG: agmatine deiminase family protein [Oscillospiraceae bacterium]|jgi:agmatine deiminase|nr:agmatine deiminase family protein [Oscillospiraceae bacterium]